MKDSVFYTGALAASAEEIKMLKSFCKDFGIDITMNKACTEIAVSNPTEIQKVLLQGFYFGLTREHLVLTTSELGKCSNPYCTRPAIHNIGEYTLCDECLQRR
ncbi:MAG TPA: hypothetical protein VH815_00415 [Acidobacteriota bacterium]